MSVCMGNGEWEPDPGEVECKGDLYALNAMDILELKYNTCHNNHITQLIVEYLVSTEM